MAGVSIKIELDLKDVVDSLGQLQARMENVEPIMKSFGEYMLHTIQQRFDDEKAPDGSPWEPHAEATRLRREANPSTRLGKGGEAENSHGQPGV